MSEDGIERPQVEVISMVEDRPESDIERKVRAGEPDSGGNWSSESLVTDPGSATLRMAFGNSDSLLVPRTDTLAPLGFFERTASIAPGTPTPSWRWNGEYKHEINCNVVRNCRSKLRWSAFILDERDGSQITWDSVEIGANTLNNLDAETIKNSPHFEFYNKTVYFGLNWEKDGRDPDFHSAAKCWLNGNWWFFEWHSHA